MGNMGHNPGVQGQSCWMLEIVDCRQPRAEGAGGDSDSGGNTFPTMNAMASGLSDFNTCQLR